MSLAGMRPSCRSIVAYIVMAGGYDTLLPIDRAKARPTTVASRAEKKTEVPKKNEVRVSVVAWKRALWPIAAVHIEAMGLFPSRAAYGLGQLAVGVMKADRHLTPTHDPSCDTIFVISDGPCTRPPAILFMVRCHFSYFGTGPTAGSAQIVS